MQTDKALPPSPPGGTATHKRSEFATTLLAALIPSFVVTLGYGSVAPAPPGTRLQVAQMWLGYWGATFVAALPFTGLVTIACRKANVRPLLELILAMLLAGLIAMLLLAALSLDRSNILG